MPTRIGSLVFGALLALAGCATRGDAIDSAEACVPVAARGLRPIAEERAERFLGKVQEDTARCRGGERAVARRGARPGSTGRTTGRPATAAAASPARRDASATSARNGRGIDGALLDLEYQRIELIKFNLFDNSGTYEDYVSGRGRRRRAGAEGRGPRCGCRQDASALRRGRRRRRSSSAAAS